MELQKQSSRTALFRGGLLFSIGPLAPLAAHALVTPLITRSLGMTDYGVVAAAVVSMQMLMTVFALGLPVSITRNVAMAASDPEGGRALTMRATAISIVIAAVGAYPVAVVVQRIFDMASAGIGVFAVAVIAAGVYAGVMHCQAYFRALSGHRSFLVLAGFSGLAGPALGLTFVTVFAATPSAYMTGILCGHLSGLASCFALFRGAMRYPLQRGAVWQALRIGLPTVPHQAAIYSVVGVFVAVASRLLGPAEAGTAQLAFIIGTTPIVLISAMNNAWSTIIYRADQDRLGVLAMTTRDMLLLAVLAAGAVAAAGPLLGVYVVGPSETADVLGRAIGVVSVSAIPTVLYMSSAHLVFLEGRTMWLIWLAPVSLGLAVFASQALGPTDLIGVVVGHPLMWTGMAVASAVVVRLRGWQWPNRAAPVGALAGMCAVSAVVVTPVAQSTWGAVTIVVAAGLGAGVLVLKRLRS